MKIVIYRNKETNKITHFHEFTKACTEEALKGFNSNPDCKEFAEFVELDENSVAYYFYTLKIRAIKDEAESLRDLEQQIRDIANAIDSRLYDFDEWFREEKGNETE